MRLVAQAQSSRVTGPGAGRPRGLLAHHRRAGRGARDARRVARRGRGGGVRRRAPRDGARHRLPARARTRRPARDRDLHDARRAERPPGARPPRAGGGTTPQDGRLRQDGHAHARASTGSSRIARPTGCSEDDALRLAAALEHDAEHPVAHGRSCASATERGLDVPEPTDFEAIPGYGVQGTCRGTAARHWRAQTCCDRLGRRRAGRACRVHRAAAARGQAVIYLSRAGTLWPPSPWPTPSGRNRPRPCAVCTSWGSRSPC